MAPSPHLLGDFPLKDKIVLITGGGSGISLTLAKLAQKHGARLLIADLKLTEEAEAFVSSSPESIKFQKTNVAKWSELSNLFTASIQHFKDVPDVVVAGAGVFDPPWSNFWDDKEDERYAEVEININHVIKLTRFAMRAMVSRSKKGVVCSIASTAGLSGFYTTPLYCATKHAVVGFTRAMAPAERLEGVKVVTVCPSAVDTPLWDDRRIEFGVDKMPPDALISKDKVAQVMFEVITEGKYGGGTVREVAAGRDPRIVTNRYVAMDDDNLPDSKEPPSFYQRIMEDDSDDVPGPFKSARAAMDKDKTSSWP